MLPSLEKSMIRGITEEITPARISTWCMPDLSREVPHLGAAKKATELYAICPATATCMKVRCKEDNEYRL